MQPSKRKRYSAEELQTFEAILVEKLEKALNELKAILEALGRKKENSTEAGMKMLEDGADVTEKENLSQLAARQRKFIAELEAALSRIKNGTYGICTITGELIPKERLAVVPHTKHSLAAKLADRTVA